MQHKSLPKLVGIVTANLNRRRIPAEVSNQGERKTKRKGRAKMSFLAGAPISVPWKKPATNTKRTWSFAR